MYRVYSDDFYNNIDDIKTTYETLYVRTLKQFASKREARYKKDKRITNLFYITNQRIKNLYNLYHSQLPELPSSFEELLLLSPENISKIYVFFLNNQTTFQRSIKKLFGKVYGPRNGIINLLNYDDFSSEIINHIILSDNERLFTQRTCCYCNHSYVNTYKYVEYDEKIDMEVTKDKQQFDLDHFIPKGKCILFSLCLYNFIPSCQVCNSRIKHDNEYYDGKTQEEIHMLFPTSKIYHYNQSLKFNIVFTKDDNDEFNPDEPNYVEFKDFFDIKLEPVGDNIYLEEAEAFHIIPRYKKHLIEFLSYIDKTRKYPSSYFLLLAQTQSEESAEDLKEAIYNHKLRNTERVIFQKIYNDLDSTFNNTNY